MASDIDVQRLTSPRIFLIGMMSFLVIVGFVALALNKPISVAFAANPGLNALIGGVLALGAVFAFRQVFRLFREIAWVNSLVVADPGRVRAPILLAPMATLLNAGAGARGLSTVTTRAILDSVGTRLDEGRELNRYLVGLLVFLGLLGTFWGLLQTVHSISGVIDSMKGGGGSTAGMFEDLKSGLSAPLAGMSVSFTSSLFGLAGSLILGFLDLQAGQAQNRFYTELEDFLAGHVETTPDEAGEDGRRDGGAESKRAAAALTHLGEAVQKLAGHMREEQQQIRDWVERQAAVQEDMRRLLRRLADHREKSL